MSPAEEALLGTLKECARHAFHMRVAREEILDMKPIDSHRIDKLSKEEVRVVDQFIFRFSRLQDAIGQKLFKYLLEASREPLSDTATFLDKLRILERINVVPSAERWENARLIRNRLAHDYPEAQMRAEILAAALKISPALVEVLERVVEFVEAKIGLPPINLDSIGYD